MTHENDRAGCVPRPTTQPARHQSKLPALRFQPQRRGSSGCLGCRLRSGAELRQAALVASGPVEIALCEAAEADFADVRSTLVRFCPPESCRPRVAVTHLLDDDLPELDGLNEWRERLSAGDS